ncbi:MAG TPA: FAD-dependent thymidylate synthase [Anaerolineales bacterium]|nr:FAD-dependent thymidylate synthase [Anaerolineales bacterium]
MTPAAERQIYLLSPRHLSPETIAVTFAKTSRSPRSFREIADELTDEKSADFHEKWVVGYGHASVAEHAVLHLAFENISRLAIECIESNRLASYTEKSTRYQKWEPGRYYLPEEVVGTAHEATYQTICDRLFDVYQQSLEPVRRVVEAINPRRPDESDGRWDGRIRSRYVDVCRFLLPASAMANVGMTVNARALEHALGKMFSHPLSEVRQIGEAAKRVVQEEVPTLVKYAERRTYLVESRREVRNLAQGMGSDADQEMLTLIAYDPEGETRVLAAALYEHEPCGFNTALDHIRSLDQEGRAALAEGLLGSRDKFDIPLRSLEHAAYTVDALMDQGAYFEVKRHRMMTQSPQRLTAKLGYAVPRLITEAGLEASYRSAMEAAAEAYAILAEWNEDVAAYVVPNGFNRRVLMTFNLREAFHFCELRSAGNAHFSVRRIALRLADLIGEVHPLLAKRMRLPEGVSWQMIEEENFSQV